MITEEVKSAIVWIAGMGVGAKIEILASSNLFPLGFISKTGKNIWMTSSLFVKRLSSFFIYLKVPLVLLQGSLQALHIVPPHQAVQVVRIAHICQGFRVARPDLTPLENIEI